MNTKKKIDRLFQEKFKNFEATPDEAVWEKIKARQNNRKRAILIPFWYRTAGVAAALAIIFTIGYVSLSPKANETIVFHDDKQLKETAPSETVTSTGTEENTPIVSTNQNENNQPLSKSKDSKNSNQKTKVNNSRTDTVFNTNQNATTTTTTKNLPKSIPNKGFLNNQKTLIADNPLQSISSDKKESNSLKNAITNKAVTIADQNKTSVPEKQRSLFTAPNEKNNDTTKGIAQRDNKSILNSKKENDSTKEEEKLEDNAHKKSIFDAIPDKEGKEAVADVEKITKKWEVAPNIAPVYYNSIGNGSSIDAQFADNDKSGQVNLSYGLNVSYAINKKLSVRSGIHKVAVNYSTQEIGFSASSILGQNLGSIDYSPNAEAIFVSDINENVESNSPLTTDIVRNAVNRNQNEGLLNQRIGYLEVPLEMKYALVNKKLGINMIGGLSTLFLQDNEISIEAGSFETSVGEANNLNDVSFSGNIGLGVDYDISDQLQINLEPIFKYQFSAINGDSNGFKPYFFGVYTGVSIKF